MTEQVGAETCVCYTDAGRKDTLQLDLPGGTIIAPDWAGVASLNSKIAQVIGTAGAIKETGFNKNDQYGYASYDDVVGPLRKAMSDAKLASYMQMVSWNQEAEGKGLKTWVEFDCVLADGETGAVLLSRWAAEAMDYGMKDKGINKCATIAQKQWLKRVFLLSTADEQGNDTDNGMRDEEEPEGVGWGTWSEKAQKAFWAKANELGLDGEAIHREFGVASMKDYEGSMDAAADVLSMLGYVIVRHSLTLDDLHNALGIDAAYEYEGTPGAGKAAIDAYIAREAGDDGVEDLGDEEDQDSMQF